MNPRACGCVCAYPRIGVASRGLNAVRNSGHGVHAHGAVVNFEDFVGMIAVDDLLVDLAADPFRPGQAHRSQVYAR